MLTIFKRELQSFFFSAIGYMVMTFMFMLSALFFFFTSILENSANLSGTFNSIFSLAAFFSPIITMRLFSEERNKKTDQILLTSPIKLSSIVLGKYFAAILLYFICISITLVYAAVISGFSALEWPIVFTSFLGMFLVGSAFISIGMFFSSITENQVVAVVVTLVTNIVVLIMDGISSSLPVKFISNFFKSLSFSSHYFQSFPMGMLKLKDVVFFVSLNVIFTLLTVRAIEKRRWS
ncbi:MAG: ABC transporter permease [Oscillospiraceae bacterium]|jgi:ABC-2 type transport system permease protein|nr:ABC transporter permease [Oscillospiraceae bacterium]